MKLISLNTWGGKVFDPLMDFIKDQYKDTDIFCFQEIYDTKSDMKQYKNIRANLLNELVKILPDFQVFYASEFEGYDSIPDPVNFDLTVGKAIFIKKGVQVISQGDFLIFGNKHEKLLKKDFSNLPVTLQHITISANDKQYTICNFHGTSFPGTKLDTEIRLKQSQDIHNFFKNETDVIITGDFNLLPQTKSIEILEAKYLNLIKDFKIERTRSDLSPFAKTDDFQKYADYTFVSGINVVNFEVPYVEISDHLPMILEFN